MRPTHPASASRPRRPRLHEHLHRFAPRGWVRTVAVLAATAIGAGAVAFLVFADGANTTARFAVAMCLFAVVGVFSLRLHAARSAVEHMVREKEALLGITFNEARTDELTGLGNRRALADDLATAIAEPGQHELLLAILDLDGFKQYNDSFGHAAGDQLLQRLADRLTTALRDHAGGAYRMGGDEFCVFARTSPRAAEELLASLSEALEASGEGWRVGCSLGAAWIPSEATTVSQALKLADERMYAGKTSPSASRQVSDALLAVFTEQAVFLDEHVERVAELAAQVAQALGLPEHEVRRIGLAARLHDIGKTAIPAAILEKPGPLDDHEWEYIRQHTLIGARIVLAAPALAETAPLIRSSHERMDGTGYPDRLCGEEIPLGSRIIAVCDAFDAMTSDRIYRPSIGVEAALAELAGGTGSQFDQEVVEALSSLPALYESAAAPHAFRAVALAIAS